MRIVYDDKELPTLINTVNKFMQQLNQKSVTAYENSTDRIQMNQVREKLNEFLKLNCNMEIGTKVTHAYGIGNNCQYPVYYHVENEIQQCAYINLNSGMFGEGFVSLEDYNGHKVGESYEITPRHIIRK